MDDAPSFLYVPELEGAGSKLTLSVEESHYVARVCRARAGGVVSATDGRGSLARLRLVTIAREVRAEVESLERSERATGAVVWCGAPEGERGDWLVEKLAELGVDAFQPLECRRGGWPRARGRVARWERLAVAALRQSRRRFKLEVRPPAPIPDTVASLDPAATRWLADPGGPAAGAAGSPSAFAVGAVGPAGGFDDDETRLLRDHGFRPISLASGRLRSETAALAWAAWWAARGSV